ncbi:hypothetical protein HF1_06810 [Mycoplasma haemofelis str. Langford 1]|uniref:Uncharacterized protein n=1 Tax=Mycoplasma haemofelis (strain Langford 1) TaxID=941640 RepID=E8ZHR8_MYCHL|nr:hypothetical protein [Mycoplasma haemofelis]CBY92689.1 hypothetical protein HF1_06810 [Mycoplasma haemofelis str. Langford 1]
MINKGIAFTTIFLSGSLYSFGSFIHDWQDYQFQQVEGSGILQDKRRGSFLRGELPFTPSFRDRLAPSHIQKTSFQQHKHLFAPEMQKYLTEVNEEDVKEGHYSDKKKELLDLIHYKKEWILTSDKEISYKSGYFQEELNNFGDNKLVQDILWSLVEESQVNATLIRPESITINFKREKVGYQKNPLLDKSDVIKNLHIKFRIFNPNRQKTFVFKSIEIDPTSETDVEITLREGELKPVSTALAAHKLSASSWSIFPIEEGFKVTKEVVYPNKVKTQEHKDSLFLLYNSSRFFEKWVGNPRSRSVSTHTHSLVDYEYVRKSLSAKLVNITTDQVKKDIERWYGSFTAFILRTKIEDMINLINLLQKNTFFDKHGNKVSVVDNAINDFTFRHNLYNHFQFDSNLRKVLDTLFLQNKSNLGLKITVKEAKALLNSWVYQLEQIKDSIRIELKWEKEPQKTNADLGYENIYPAFSYKFTQKFVFTKEVKIPLKGTYNTTENKFEEATTETENKHKFDLSNRLKNVKVFLTPISFLFNGMNGGSIGGVSIMDVLIPDVANFVDLESLTIDANQEIKNTYESKNSPITLAIGGEEDMQKIHFPGTNIGWKSLDVTHSQDLSKFTKLFYKLYEKFDTYKDGSGVALNTLQLLQANSRLSKDPISFIAHAINSIFDKNYLQSKQSDESKRPWPIFFNTLLGESLNFKSKQLLVGLSSLFFAWDTEWDSEAEKEKCDGQGQEKYYCTKFSLKNSRKKQILPNSEETKNVTQKFFPTYSSYFPEKPVVFGTKDDTTAYDAFLAKEGKSSIGLVNNYTKLKEVFKSRFEKDPNFFPSNKEINWNNAKVSYVRLNLEKAIKSVLALKNEVYGMLGITVSAIGIEFHKILGEALVRDGFWINMNLMDEKGSFWTIEHPIKHMFYSPFSESWLFVKPDLDHTKLELGSLMKKKK